MADHQVDVHEAGVLERRVELLTSRLAGHVREWDALGELLGYRSGTSPAVLVEHVAGVLRMRSEAAGRCKAAEVRVAQLEGQVEDLHRRLGKQGEG